jgi:LmbE family N-acetylglucosaminyl deacetylase
MTILLRAARRLAAAAVAAGVLCMPAAAQKYLSGAAQTKLALERLNVVGSMMLIAAHPDDENAALLAYMSRGRKVRAAYLSLTRGDGGQNLIGSEQGELLGVIRTQEMLAARRIDGAEQYFTRAIDFGFSKSAEETFEKWGHDAILADVVWIIRRYRPDVIFGGVGAGHGHHQAAAILGREAFVAAADKTRFPEQLQWVEPWQAKRLVGGGFGPGRGAAGGQPGVRIDTGEYNPWLGYSYGEIAGMSRSMHKSQGVGAPERRGSAVSVMSGLDGAPAVSDPFEGIDTTWNRLPGGAAVAPILAEAARSFIPEQPEKTIPLLLKARPLIAAIRDPWAALKLRELDEAVALCAGLYLDAATDRHAVAPGERLTVNIEATSRSPFPLELKSVRLEGMPGAAAEDSSGAALAFNQPLRRALTVTIPSGQPYTQPYWLRAPSNGFTFALKDQQLVGLAENPPPRSARLVIPAGAQQLEFVRPVVRRYVDRVDGETTRPLAVVPPVAVRLSDPVVLFPDAQAKTIEVQLTANVEGAAGEVRLEAPQGWRVAPASGAFRLVGAGEEATVAFTVTPPAGAATGELRAVASVSGRLVSHGVRVVAHEGIPPQTVFPPASARLVRADVRTLAKRIGYVMGAGDEVPAALRQIGCEVTLLGAQDLARGDLSRFDAIVTGVRAYNVRPDLFANQQRLMEYVERGGTLVVQYLTPDGRSPAVQGFAPYPLQVGGSRVTLEDAAVAILDPTHPLVNVPNRIAEDDFRGWVQERGLYFASQWDRRYTPLFESHDPGEPPQRGITLYARHGKGAFVFTAFSMFRELPAGVAGGVPGLRQPARRRQVRAMKNGEPPPVLGSWPRLYAAVLGWLALLIVLFHLFARRVTP